MNEDIQVAGVFEDHYADRYKRSSPSVQAYQPDARSAFESGELVPSDVPRETLGMDSDHAEVLSRYRVEKNQMYIDNPEVKENDDGGFDFVPTYDEIPETPKDDRIRMFNDLTRKEQASVLKDHLLKDLVEKDKQRIEIDMSDNFASKLGGEVIEGVYEGFENTARAAAILTDKVFPPTDPFSIAMADIRDNNMVPTSMLRPEFIPDIKNQDGIGWALTRGFAQFMPNFIAVNKMLAGFGALRTAHMTRGAMAGFPADYAAFDSAEGNLSDLMIMLGDVNIEGENLNMAEEFLSYMSAGNKDSQAEARFRNALEGGLIGLGLEGILKLGIKGYNTKTAAETREQLVQYIHGTAKNMREFKRTAGDMLEQDAMQQLREAGESRKAVEEGDVIEMHGGGLPVSTHQLKTVRAMSELALAKIVRGDLDPRKGYDQFKAAMDEIDAEVGLTVGKQLKKHGTDNEGAEKGFKKEAIGTGEGAQAYSYGHYVATRDEVSEWYWNKQHHINEFSVDGIDLVKNRGYVDYTPSSSGNSEYQALLAERLLTDEAKMKHALKEGGDPHEYVVSAIKEMIDDNELEKGLQDASGDLSYYEKFDEFLQKTLANVEGNKDAVRLETEVPGGIHNVEVLPDVDKDFLDWDAIIDEQPENVMKALEATDWWRYASESIEQRAGARGKNPTGAELYEWLLEDYEPEEAAQLLLDAGIKGMKYLDGMSRNEGKGTHNFVIYDDADLHSVAKNGQYHEDLIKQSWDNAVEYYDNKGLKPDDAAPVGEVSEYGEIKQEGEYKNLTGRNAAGDRQSTGRLFEESRSNARRFDESGTAEGGNPASPSEIKTPEDNPNTQIVLNSLMEERKNVPLKLARLYQRDHGLPATDHNSTLKSSLNKQSQVSSAFLAAPKGDENPAYKEAVFGAYAERMPELIQKYGITDYDDLMTKAYDALQRETIEQFQYLPTDLSYHSGAGEYSRSSQMLVDAHMNNHLFVFQGGDEHQFLNAIDESTGLNSNEIFRAVHDYFGHAIRGNQFGAQGEEMAWNIHQQMFSDLAQIAMTSETRGQNSVVNYSPINRELWKRQLDIKRAIVEAKRMKKKAVIGVLEKMLEDTWQNFQFAEQKSVVLPPEFLDPGYNGEALDYMIESGAIKPEHGVDAVGFHYGNKSGLSELSGEYHGTGTRGEERAHTGGLPASEKPVFFYVPKEGAEDVPEASVKAGKPAKYKGNLSGLYDLEKDPAGLRELAGIKNTSDPLGNINPGTRDQTQQTLDLHRTLKAYGYKGFLGSADKSGQRAAVVFGKQAVEEMK